MLIGGWGCELGVKEAPDAYLSPHVLLSLHKALRSCTLGGVMYYTVLCIHVFVWTRMANQRV